MGGLKILMLNHEFVPVGGGAAPVTLELCKHLVRMGHEVDVVTMHFGDLPGHECVEGVNVYRTPAIRKRPDICHTHEMATYLPGALPKALKLCRGRKYDVMHCHFIVPGGPLAYTLGKLTGVPYLITCHGSDVPGYNPDRFGFAHKMIMPAWKFLTRRAGLLVSPSESLRGLIQSHCPEVEVEVVPNGIYPEVFRPKTKKKRILMCSRILPRKGFQFALEAVKDMEGEWEVHVVGEGPFLGELKRIAAGSRMAVKFHGWLDREDDRLHELFRESAIFVFPSESENFPSVLLEAMSAGMAIVTSTAGGCPEVVGEAGVLVEPRDVAGLREHIGRLMESEELRERLGAAALERSEKFSWGRIAEEYVRRYRAVMRG